MANDEPLLYCYCDLIFIVTVVDFVDVGGGIFGGREERGAAAFLAGEVKVPAAMAGERFPATSPP